MNPRALAKTRLAIVLGVAVSLTVAASCFTRSQAPRPPAYRYRVPQVTNDGWLTASRDEERIDAQSLDEMFERIHDGTYKEIHSVLVVRKSKLVVEEYFAGTHPVLHETIKEGADWDGKYQNFDRDTPHTVQSATKSVVSILVGIAIDQKLIAGPDEKIATFFPEFTGRDEIRLHHFLSMTPGLQWDEWVPLTDPRNDCERMNNSDDPIALLLRRPSVAPPGSTWNYNSAVSVALGEIVHKTSGMPVDQFAAKNLFEPMGITHEEWKGRFPSGAFHTGGGLYLCPRDMAKIGWMMLDNGRWRGKQIVSESWVRASLTQQAAVVPPAGGAQVPGRGYGYQWWIRTFDVAGRKLTSFFAGGYGGQFIFLFPDLDLVVVSTGWNPNNGAQFVGMMERHILPAVR